MKKIVVYTENPFRKLTIYLELEVANCISSVKHNPLGYMVGRHNTISQHLLSRDNIIYSTTYC